MISIGIDPGVNGGIAVMNDTWSDTPIKAVKCPETIKDMVNFVKEVKWDCIPTYCVIEKVHSMPKQGVRSVWTFGKNYGQWVAILSSLDVPFMEVTPQKWMKFYGSMPKDRKSRKNHLKHLAQSLYPKINVTLATADAILLCHYAKGTGIIDPTKKEGIIINE